MGWRGPFLALAWLAVLGCGPGTVDARLATYAAEVDVALERGSAPLPTVDTARFKLPPRRVRRLEAPEERIGPIDFLATIGCPFSEIAAERNGPLGRVLVPTRRWDYERRVRVAIDACAATLGEARREKLENIALRKRATAWVHEWNAIWLPEPIERYLSSGPAALFAGRDAHDGPLQLRRIARALEAGDLSALEGAHRALRDDPAAGPRLAAAARSAALLHRVAETVSSAGRTECDRSARRGAVVFEHRFVPLNEELAVQSAFVRDFVEAMSMIFAVSPKEGSKMPAMSAYRQALLGDGASEVGLDQIHRDALVTHARAWSPILTACGVLPAA